MLRRILQLSTAIVFAVVIISGCTTPPQKPDPIIPGNYDYVKEYITWFAKKEMEKNQVVGLSIALVDDQEIVWAEGFGYADLKNEKPATAETVYRIASISKLFTVMAALQLAEQGRIDIDRPLKTYLPEFSVKSRFPDADPITLRSIMTHHSGLPSGVPKGMWTSEPPETLLYRLKDEYAAFPPNYVLTYSNVAMALLGPMIERVSSTDFCDYMEKAVLNNMEMQQSSFKLQPEIEGLLSKGYKKGVEAVQIPLRDLAAGSMYSNVIDLSRFIQMVFTKGLAGNRQILKSETIDEMLQPQNENVVLDFGKRVGLGWFLNYRRFNNLKVAQHSGATPLFRSRLMIIPEKKLGVVVLTNSAEGARIHGKIGNEVLKLALEAKTGISGENHKEPIAPPDGEATEAMLQSFVGKYATRNMIGTVERKSKELDAEFEKYSFRLTPSSDGKFGVKRYLLGIFPIRKVGKLELAKIRVQRMDFEGRDLLAVHNGDRHWFTAEKINPLPIPAEWEQALGEYEIINPDKYTTPVGIRLSKKMGLLEISYDVPFWYSARAKLYLRPISATEAVTTGIQRYSGETMRMIDIAGETGLAFWGYKMKKLN